MKKWLLILALTILCPAVFSQTTTAYGITFNNAHPRLWMTPSRLTTMQTWITNTSYAGSTRTDGIPALEDTLFTCYVGSGMAGAIGTTAATACTNIIAWANGFTVACSSGNGCDGMRTEGIFIFLGMDWLYPGCGKASCFAAGDITSLITLWNTYMTNQDAAIQYWGNIGMPASNYFAGQVRNDILFGISTYTDNASADAFLAYGINKTLNANTRWNDYQNYTAQSGTPGGTVDVALANAGYGLPQQEGSEYGRYNANYYALVNASLALDGRDTWKETPAFESIVLSLIYATTPESTVSRSQYDVFEWGDDENWVNGGSGPQSRYWCDFMNAAAQEYPTIAIGKLARTWASNIGTTNCGPTWLSIDPGGSTQALSTLPLDYYASGPQFMFARDNWTATATEMMWQLGLDCGMNATSTASNCQGHAHFDVGTFQLYRKGVWMAKETSCYAETVAGFNDTGLVNCTDGLAHNVPVVGGVAGVNAGCVDGRGIVGRLETQTNYAYAEVDLTKAYTNNVCDGGHPARENGHVVVLIREQFFFRTLGVEVVFDRFQNDLSTTGTTFISHCDGSAFTLSTPTATCVSNGQEAKYFSLIPTTPSMVDVNEHDNSATCVITGFPECQHRLESTFATPGNVINYQLNVIQMGDSSGFSSLSPSVMDSSSGTPASGIFTVTLDGSNSLVLNKGTSSSGGTITATGITRSLTSTVQTMTVTDNGNVWAGQNPSPSDEGGTVIIF